MIDHYIERLKKYLPTFVDTKNELIKAFLFAIASTLATLDDGIVILRKCYHVGKGLIMSAREYIIFHTQEETELNIQARMEQRYDILTARGSESGISADLGYMLGAGFDHADFYGIDECGWIGEQTFPGIDFQNVIDLNKLIVIHYDSTKLVMNNYKEKIERYLIPLDILIMYYDITTGFVEYNQGLNR